jgi:hypothetical protein
VENLQLATIGHSAPRVKTYVLDLSLSLRPISPHTSHLGGEPGQNFYSSRLIRADKRSQQISTSTAVHPEWKTAPLTIEM